MDEALKIDWTQMPTYNTIMSVAAGAGMLSLVWLGWSLVKGREVSFEGHALNFGVLGFILTLTGAHMTLTWPFAKYFPFDNIIFGEPSLGFGGLLGAAAFLLWKRRETIETADDPAAQLVRIARPLSIFVFGLGLALIAIAIGGITFQLFAAPPQDRSRVRSRSGHGSRRTFMSGLFALAGIGALLFPFAAIGPRHGAGASHRFRPSRARWRPFGPGVPAVRRLELLHPHRTHHQHHVKRPRAPQEDRGAGQAREA